MKLKNHLASIFAGLLPRTHGDIPKTVIYTWLKAADEGNMQTLESLHKRHGHAILNARGNNGETALHMASAAGQQRVIEYLIHSGADINAQKNDGWTPLMLVADGGNFPHALLLLTAGANPCLCTPGGLTALQVAVDSYFDTGLIKLLSHSEKSMKREILAEEEKAIYQGVDLNKITPPAQAIVLRPRKKLT